MKIKGIKTVAFDADDTLWTNEIYFRRAEEDFCRLMNAYLPPEQTVKELFDTETQNIPLYGYGSKGFTLSLIETALRISDGAVTAGQIRQITDIGKRLLSHPIELLPGARETLQSLRGKYRLVLATKGDLAEQRRKLALSGLEPYFDHIEIMADKQPRDYTRLIQKLGVHAQETLMAGNSLKSDVAAPLEAGAYGFYIPSSVTWAHEHAPEPENPRFYKIEKLQDILAYLL